MSASSAVDGGREGQRSPARRSAFRALLAWERGKVRRVADALGREDLDERDRALAQELAFGVLRRQILIDTVLGAFLRRGLPRSQRATAALRLGAWQLLFADRIPAHAAVDESVRLAGEMRGLVNGVLRNLARCIGPRVPDDASDPRRTFALDDADRAPRRVAVEHDVFPVEPNARTALRFGLPTFLVERWATRHGDTEARRLAAATVATPVLHLRGAPHVSGAQLAELLAGQNVEVARHADDASVVTWTGGGGGRSPLRSDAFAAGAAVVQDPTALDAVRALGAQPGEAVLDLCAAPGTKTSWLGAAVQPDGRVVAYDAVPARRELVTAMARRLGLTGVEVVDSVDDLPPASFDRVLVDAPCSNTGVLARRVEARLRLEPGTFASLASMQRDLLEQGLSFARPGGTVVYSTCSLEPEENDDVVAAVVANRPDVEVVDARTTLPAPPARDGGFFAVLRVGSD